MTDGGPRKSVSEIMIERRPAQLAATRGVSATDRTQLSWLGLEREVIDVVGDRARATAIDVKLNEVGDAGDAEAGEGDGLLHPRACGERRERDARVGG